MTRQVLALALIEILALSCVGQAQPSQRPSPREQAHAIAANSAVEVKFVDGAHRRGWISEVSDTGFVLSTETKGVMVKSPMTFVQVKAIKQVKSVRPSHIARNVLIGVGIAFGALVVLGLAEKAAGCC
jgi:hypothetical protein